MSVGKQFDAKTPLHDSRRSYGVRRKRRGCTVDLITGEPRSRNVPAGGNSPRHNSRRGRKHTTWARLFWERNGRRDQPPLKWARGWS